MSAELWMTFILSLQKMMYVVPMHVNTTFTLRLIEVYAVPNIPRKHQLLVVSIPLKALIGFEYIQKSKGLSDDSAGQSTRFASPPKFWFRCCLTVNRKWGGVPSCMNHIGCRWRGGTLSKDKGISLNKPKVHCTCQCVMLDKQSCELLS